jgi:eukaryotic-like serine/threonine-protein kinase
MQGRQVIARSYNGWAWLLATCPVANLRNPQDAVSYAKRAVDLESTNYQIWNTLGVAYYRAGNWEEARSALYRSMELNDEGGAFDWFFLAMIHAKFGHKERAQDWYDKAVQWSHDRGGDSVELYRFQIEAAEVLGLPKPERIVTPTTSKVARPPQIVYPWVIQRKGRGQLLAPNQPEN